MLDKTQDFLDSKRRWPPLTVTGRQLLSLSCLATRPMQLCLNGKSLTRLVYGVSYLGELEKEEEETGAAFMADEVSKSCAAQPPLEETGNTEADTVALKLEDRDCQLEDGDSDRDASFAGPADEYVYM